MPELDFAVTGVEAAMRGLVPLLHFTVEISNQPPEETIQSIILQAQIQIEAPQRSYSPNEKDKLFELFGRPEQWGQTLHNKLWTHSQTNVRSFKGKTDAVLAVPCSYDLHLAATKYFYGLENGEVPLLFLFSGTIFYIGADGRLQVQQISWEKESKYRMSLERWKELMDHHYPNTSWIYLERDVFDQLCAFKRKQGLPTWEQAIEELLAKAANGDESRDS